MTHADLDDLAALVLDPDDVSDELRRHVASCPDCGALLASLADVRRVAGEDELVPAPDRVREQVLSHVRSPAAPDPSDDPADPSGPAAGRRAGTAERSPVTTHDPRLGRRPRRRDRPGRGPRPGPTDRRLRGS